MLRYRKIDNLVGGVSFIEETETKKIFLFWDIFGKDGIEFELKKDEIEKIKRHVEKNLTKELREKICNMKLVNNGYSSHIQNHSNEAILFIRSLPLHLLSPMKKAYKKRDTTIEEQKAENDKQKEKAKKLIKHFQKKYNVEEYNENVIGAKHKDYEIWHCFIYYCYQKEEIEYKTLHEIIGKEKTIGKMYGKVTYFIYHAKNFKSSYREFKKKFNESLRIEKENAIKST